MGYEAWIALGCFIGTLALIFIGLPVFVCILLASLVGFWLVGGPAFTFAQFTNAPYNLTANYLFAVVPMFILMGELTGESGLAESAYRVASQWLSRIRGGLLMATVVGAALFGACSGVSLASSAVFTKVSMPELDRYNFDRSLSLGCIAASGGLSTLIPPSVSIIIFCVIAQVSIGKALVAGIIPGILVTIFTVGTIWIMGIFRPRKLPLINIQVNWKDRFLAIPLLLPIFFVFILVVGGMYVGIFPPTVGGAIAAFGVLIYALVRRVKKQRIIHSFREAVLTNAQIFPILIGGFIFSRFIALSGLPNDLVGFINNIHLPPLVVMLFVMVLYLFLGCVMEIFSIMIITIPIVFPVLTSLGYNPLTLCIVLVFLSNIAGITPPIGMQGFVVASAAKVDPMVVFRGILPFFFVHLGICCIIILFPSLCTWLPSLFF